MKKINIYQIESTSACSATCSFCPHPTMERKKSHMDLDIFLQTLHVMKNDYVALHHFGEPLLNRNLPSFIREAYERGIKVEFSTNGNGVNSDLFLQQVMDAEPYLMRIAYDFFQPIEFIKKVLTFNHSTIIKLHAVTPGLLPKTKPLNNWAGQMNWGSEIHGKDCYFLKYKYHAVLQDGTVVRCCQDYDGKYPLGHVYDTNSIQESSTIPLCETCSGMQFAEDGLWKEEE